MSQKQKDYERELEQQKSASTLQLLFKAARLLNEHALARTESDVELRAAHTALVPHIDLEGTRLVELARRVGTSKQAVGQLVDDLEALGTCERVADPNDGRAKLIRFSAKGRRQLLDGLSLLRQIEAELARELGERRMQQLKRTLERILASELLTRSTNSSNR